MSLLPSRLFDQHFGMGLNEADLLMPFTTPQEISRLMRIPSYYRPWRMQTMETDAGSEITIDKDKFQIHLDVQHFTPEEITVKTTGENVITIEAKHEEKQDEHGFISRQFRRKYVLPKGHDIQQVQSKLSSDGVLTINAPKISETAIENRHIPIHQTGVPAQSIKSSGASSKSVEKKGNKKE